MIQKRQKRGGIKTKASYRDDVFHNAKEEEEPVWEGFGSDSEMHTDSASSDDDTETEDTSAEEDDASSHDEEGDGNIDTEVEDDEDDESEDSDESDDEPDSETAKLAKQERSSAFKDWATSQRNAAMGYDPVSTIQAATETTKIEGFIPRPREEDPLPLELLPSRNLQRKAYSVTVDRSPDIQAIRLHLPVVAEEQKIMEAVHNNSIIVVYGATGSGKTTQIPQFLYEAGYGSVDSPTPGIIGVTQPRRVAAVSMAKRVGDEMGDHGDKVAYQIRFEGTVGPQTAIKFMTDGVLLREVAQDIALRRYSAIVIDEAHERSVNTDILIGMMSRVIRLREELSQEDPSIKPLKLIIMSATLRITDFTDNATLFPVPPPVLQAEGRQYPVTNHFARKTHHDYVEEAFRKVCKGHKKLPPGGFLVFLTGQNEITHLTKKLKEAFQSGTTASGPKVRISGQDAPMETEDIDFGGLSDDERLLSDDEVEENDDADFDVAVEEGEAELGPAKVHVLPLYSLLPTKEQLRVFDDPPDGSRLIVLATNVAETSLTIPGIKYVFDSGRSKERKFNKQTGVQSFEVGWISKASASQRAGRAGRTGPGHCYKLYSSAVYERDFEEYAEPEILRMPIEGVVLQLKAMNLQNVVNFPFPTPPDRQSLASSEKLLTHLLALTSEGTITPTGITMSIFPLSPRFARILLIGHLHDCLQYTIALVAGLSAADVFIPENQAVPQLTPKEADEIFTQADRLEEDARNIVRSRYNKVHHQFCAMDDKADAIKLLQVVAEYAHDSSEAWCKHHFVRSKPLKEALQLRRQITDLLRMNIPAFANLQFQAKLNPPSSKQVKALKQMVAAGFIDHVAMREDKLPVPVEGRRKPTRAIEVPYVTLFPSHASRDEEDKAVYIHPSSVLAHVSPNECPDYIIYAYLQKAAPSAATPERIPKTRMHALTDITGGQLAAVAKGTPLLTYGKPVAGMLPKTWRDEKTGKEMRECVVPRYLRAESSGSQGWPLPAAKVTQRKDARLGWVVV